MLTTRVWCTTCNPYGVNVAAFSVDLALSLAAFPPLETRTAPVTDSAEALPVPGALPQWMQLLFAPATVAHDIETDPANATEITAIAAPPERIADAIVRTMLRTPQAAVRLDPPPPEFPPVPGKILRSVGTDKIKTSTRLSDSEAAPLPAAVHLSLSPLPFIPFSPYVSPAPSTTPLAPADPTANVSSMSLPSVPRQANAAQPEPTNSGLGLRGIRPAKSTMRGTKPAGPPELDELVTGVPAGPVPALSPQGEEHPALAQMTEGIPPNFDHPAIPFPRVIADQPEHDSSPSRQQTGELAFAAVLSLKDDAGSEPHQKPAPKIVPRPLSDVKKLQSVADFTPVSSGETAVSIAPAEHPSPMLVAAAPAASSQMAAAPPAAVSDKPAPTSTPPQAPVESPQIAEPYATDSAPVRELAVRIAPPGRLPVDVRVHQQRGETHVVVRAGEETTRAILRQDLPHLVTALDRAGFHTETFADTESKASTFTGDSDNNRGSFRDSSPSDFSRNSAGNPSQSGQHQQRHREQLHSYWLEQMES